MMYLGIFLHPAESTHCHGVIGILKQRFGCARTQRIGPVLDVKVLCHHHVHGIEIQIPSTFGDKTKVWVVMSRSSNRHVDELRQRMRTSS